MKQACKCGDDQTERDGLRHTAALLGEARDDISGLAVLATVSSPHSSMIQRACLNCTKSVRASPPPVTV